MSIQYSAILRETATLRPKHAKRLEQHAQLLETVPEAKRENVARALSVLHREYPWKGDLESIYPLADQKYQAQLVLGEPPATITGLTAKEAHEYLSHPTHHSPADWLIYQRNPALRKETNLFIIGPGPRDVPSARWVIACTINHQQREALFRERVIHGPGGQEIRGRLIDRIDELTVKDLCGSVEKTFDRAAKRMWKSAERLLAKDKTDLCPVPQWWQPMRCTRLLRRAAELVIEGKEMSHCVATYAPAVKQNQSIIVTLNVRGYRSTAEFTRSGKLVQHKGPANNKPHSWCERALNVLMRRCGLITQNS